MILNLTGNFGKRSFCIAVMFLLFFFSAGVCGATVNKSTALVVVSTTDQNNWYDDKDSSLNTFTVCDKDQGGRPYTKTVPCNTDGVHDDYYSTDTKDERNVYPKKQNFTIKASASASSGSMSKIKFDWIASITTTPTEADWNSSVVESYTCPASEAGACTVCLSGGSCANDVIPREYLGVHPRDGAQRRFFFRVTFASGSDSVTTGWDSTLDKYYRFVICGPLCHSCVDYTPTVRPSSAQAPKSSCDGLNNVDDFFTVGWTDENMPSSAEQTYYKVSVRKKADQAIVGSRESTSRNYSDTTFEVPSEWLVYGTVYEWQVQVNFKGEGCEWKNVMSPWSSGSANIDVSNRYPNLDYDVVNSVGANCLQGGCFETESLKFYTSNSTASVNPVYNWIVDGVKYSGADFVIPNVTGNKHTFSVTVTDSYGHSCSDGESFELGNSSKTCETGIPSPTLVIYKPTSLCGGLDDDGAHYEISWSTAGLPKGARQSNYEVILQNANDSTDTKTISVGDSDTMISIPVKYTEYGKTYKVMVKLKIVSVNKKCTWDLESDWISGGTVVVPARYPEPLFTVKNVSGSKDCVSGGCNTDEMLTFDGRGSKVYAGTAKYEWILDGKSDSAKSYFDRKFPDQDHEASLTVTDGVGNSCSTSTKEISLMNPLCPPGPTVDSLSVSPGNLCDGKYYEVSWKNNNLPAGAKQTGYEVKIQNKDVPSDVSTYSLDSDQTSSWITHGLIQYENNYTVQVKAKIASASGKCSWTVPSSGTVDFSVPHRYPVPILTVQGETLIAGACPYNCLAGECCSSKKMKFSANTSIVSTPVATNSYDWILDGKSYSGESFDIELPNKEHKVHLTITDSDGHSCASAESAFVPCTTVATTRPQAGWTEIAPVTPR